MMANIALYILLSFAAAFLFFYVLIPTLKKDRMTQFIREEGPKSHLAKAGTPTGGGIVFLIIPALFIPIVKNEEFLFIYLSLLLNGLIGAIDDFAKVRKKNNLGLTARGKFILQLLVTSALYFLFAKHLTHYVSLGRFSILLPPFLYFLLFLFIGTGTTNAFNLTDGIDGLLTSVSIPIFAVFLILGGGFVKSFSAVSIGMLLAYLWFNSPKAELFMGDTGSLALGGAVFAISVLGKFEVLLAFLAVIPVIETLSVIIQVSYFKLSGGKRIFKMAPLHHHFELSGWNEAKIVFRFFIITVISSVIGIFIAGGAK